jgi:hypothetical protein
MMKVTREGSRGREGVGDQITGGALALLTLEGF